MVDIGHSAYSQLQKLKGQEIDYEDAEDDGDNNEAKDFFKKSSENAKMDVKSKTASVNMIFCLRTTSLVKNLLLSFFDNRLTIFSREHLE